MMTGKRCDCRSQSRSFWIVGRLPTGWLLPPLTPRPMLRTSPLNTRPGHDVEQDLDRRADVHVAEVVLGELGVDPDVVDPDQRQHRAAGAGIAAHVGGEVRDDAA